MSRRRVLLVCAGRAATRGGGRQRGLTKESWWGARGEGVARRGGGERCV